MSVLARLAGMEKLARSNLPVRIAQGVAMASRHNGPLMLTAYEQLKPSERSFVDVYLLTDSPTKAARAAYPSITESLLNVRALDMLRRPLIQAAIAAKLEAVSSRYAVTLDRTVAEIAKIAYANMGDYVRINDEGEPVPDFSNVDYDQMAAVKTIKTETVVDPSDKTKEIKKVTFELHPKLDGLDKLMKKLGGYAPVGMSLTGPNGGPLQVEHSRGIDKDMTAEQAALIYQRSLEE